MFASCRGSMKRFLNFNFGLDEVSGASGSTGNDDEGDEGEEGGGHKEGKEHGGGGADLFDMVCKERFRSAY